MAELGSVSAGGEMGARIRAFDWASTPLGPRDGWPAPLRVTLDLCLRSPFPMAIYWGPELRLLYNDGWSPIPGERHPDAFGRPGHEVWHDIWPIVGPQFAEVIASGQGFATSEQALPMTQSGRRRESYWDYSFTPIFGDDGRVAGILNQGQEVTARVEERRQHALTLALAERLRGDGDPDGITLSALELLGTHLSAARVGYAKIDAAAGTATIVANWRRDAGVADLTGDHPLLTSDTDLRDVLLTGETFAIDDADAGGGAAAGVHAALGVRAVLVTPVLKAGVCAAAVFAHHDQPHGWTTYDERLLANAAERIWQARGRARAARALRESERRHRLIFEQANDIVFTADLDRIVTGANPAAGRALGVEPAALIGRSLDEFVSPEAARSTRRMLRRKLRRRGPTRYEIPVRGFDGRMLQWEINSTLSTDDAGTPTGIHAIARNITERHRHEQEQRRLIDELNHRVKNMLAQVQGLAQQSFRGPRAVADAQRVFQDRLGALAAAYDLLTRGKWGGATLDETVAGGTRHCAGDGGQMSRGGPPVALSPKTAVSLVMAFHELTTNACDHGALSVPEGRVDIRWRTADGRLLIEWRESGGPDVAAPARRGFGLRMIERALAADLSASVVVDFTLGGLVCRIDAPLGADDEVPA